MDSDTKNTLERIWHVADAERAASSSAPQSMSALLHAVSTGRIEGVLTPEVIAELLNSPRQRQMMGECFSTLPVADLVAKIAINQNPKTVLDPTCGSGYMLHRVLQTTSPERAYGVEINAEAYSIAKELLGDNADVLHTDFFRAQDDLPRQIDLVVADPPLGLRTFISSDDRDAANGPDAREFTEALAFWSCERLSDHGMAILLVPNRFTWDRRFHQKLHARGGCILGFIHFPRNAILGTTIPAYLMLLTKGSQDDIFIGEVGDDKHNDVLLANLSKPGARGASPANGRGCSREDFCGFPAFEADFRIKRKLTGTDYRAVATGDLFTRISRVRNSPSFREEFDPASGDLVIHITGRKVIRNVDDLPDRLHNYIHVRLNADLAEPYYFEKWLGSDLGKLFLESISRGSAVSTIDLTSFRSTEVHLPNLSHQKEVSAALMKLDAIDAEVSEARQMCWDVRQRPSDTSELVDNINHADTYDGWIESLPYPLASVLWRHKTSPDSARLRYPILSDFFEALAAFLANVHLSAFMSDEDLWFETRSTIQRRLGKANLSLERATFGTWKCICEVLSKQARTMLKDKEQKNLLFDLYCLHEEDFFSRLVSAKLSEIIGQANGYRNTYLGHSGAMSEREAGGVEQKFVDLVNETRGTFGRGWKNFELIKATSAIYRNGRYTQSVPLLMGTRSQFASEVRVTTSPLEDGQLYLLNRSEDCGLKLQPFVKMGASPAHEANACYFYNRVESNKLRFVSYHFEDHAELRELFEDTKIALHRITHEPKLPGREDVS